jgi:hypothetical protein
MHVYNLPIKLRGRPQSDIEGRKKDKPLARADFLGLYLGAL